ncbi:nucleoside triphosphate pyrophosphatase [Porticoccaceae bacterium LTM1]|nr:nucleoside triphosphate pyrophosphatase [Porticoccaceae bacterium LTM1]
MTTLVLASSSPYRKSLLDRLSIPYTCQSPEIDESPKRNETPLELVRRLSREKAAALQATHPNHLIIGSDQVAELNGQIITKPGCFENARLQLKEQSGNSVRFHTGLCVLNSSNGESETDVVTTTASFRTLSDSEIERYLYKEEPFDCAGSFKCEQLGISLLESMLGPDPTALIGLPLIRLCEMLRNQGIQAP